MNYNKKKVISITKMLSFFSFHIKFFFTNVDNYSIKPKVNQHVMIWKFRIMNCVCININNSTNFNWLYAFKICNAASLNWILLLLVCGDKGEKEVLFSDVATGSRSFQCLLEEVRVCESRLTDATTGLYFGSRTFSRSCENSFNPFSKIASGISVRKATFPWSNNGLWKL